jgi:hypothetical protein
MKAIRFRPPSLEATAELRWVLHRAFADPKLPFGLQLNSEAAFALAGRCGLASRIAVRSEAGTLKREIGPLAARFLREGHLAAAGALRYQHVLQEVARISAATEIPAIVLKGAALDLLGISPAGARSFSDLDILVPEGRIPEFRAALVESGWALSPLPSSEHQEPVLSCPGKGAIELHRYTPGVRTPGHDRFLDAESLLRDGLVQQLPGFRDPLWAPSLVILAAHALVHGLVQHRFSPAAYPPFRVLADLQDLRSAGAAYEKATAYLPDFDEGDVDAVETLLDALASGTACEMPASPGRTLLEHVAAGALNERYGVSMKSDLRFLLGVTGERSWAAAPGRLLGAIFISREQVDALYGPPKNAVGYLARQAFRPLDLACKYFRAARARLARSAS